LALDSKGRGRTHGAGAAISPPRHSGMQRDRRTKPVRSDAVRHGWVAEANVQVFGATPSARVKKVRTEELKLA